MKKLVWTTLLILSVLISYGQGLSMRSTNAGFSAQFGAGTSGWQSTKSDEKPDYGTDIALKLAYGFNENIEAFGGANISMFSAKHSDQLSELKDIEHEVFDVRKSFNFFEARLGAKYTFGSTVGPVRFYVSLAATYFTGDLKTLDWDYFNYQEVNLEGFGLTPGAGLKYHLSLPVAIVLDATMTIGSYSDYVADYDWKVESTFHTHRINVGVVVYFDQF